MPTYTTIPLILLIALLWRLTKGNVLSIIAFTAIFDAASALNFGALGVSPWLFALVLCLPIKMVQGRLQNRVPSRLNWAGLYLLIAFLLCATFSGLVYPFLFQGVLVVRGIDVVPLSWGMPNIAQLCYLAAAAVVFYLAVTSSLEERANAITWYVRGCIAATLIAMYQLANAVLHVPYPDAILYSNTAHVVYHAYRINGLWRLNSTFTEASDMAGSLIGGLGVLGWEVMTKPLRLSRTLSFVLMLLAILMTLSTTGYVCLAVMVLLGVALYLRYVLGSGGIDPAKLVVLLLLSMAVGTVFVVSHAARESATKLLYSVVLDKRGTDSYKARTESQVDAMKTLSDTDYLGAGLGSTRASGLGYTLLAGTGVPGLVLFTLAYLAMFRPLLQRPERQQTAAADCLLERSLLAMTLLLCSMVLAGSEPNMPMLWLLFGTALTSTRSAFAGRSRPGIAGWQGRLPSTDGPYRLVRER